MSSIFLINSFSVSKPVRGRGLQMKAQMMKVLKAGGS